MKNKRLDELYKQILVDLIEDPSFDINYDKHLEKFKKSLTEEDIKNFSKIFKYKNLRMVTGEIPKTLDPIEGAFKILIDIHNSKKLLSKLLCLEAIVFERDKYYAKSTMCKACKEIRLRSFANYEKVKSLLC